MAPGLAAGPGGMNLKGNDMKLQGATLLITGANRSLGLAFAREAPARRLTPGLSPEPAVYLG